MAKRIDTSNLTVDFRQLMKMTVQDRVDFYKSGGQSYFESLTPTQLAQLFPKYYQKQLPDIGKVVSGGTEGTTPVPTTGGGVTSGALGRAARSQAAPGQPQGQPKPSSTAQENAFLKYLEGITGKPSQQQTSSQNIPDGMNPLAIDRQNASKNLSREDKIHMYALSIAEKGDKTPKRNAELMESIYNRYMAQRKPSIQSTMMSDYYQPLRPEADPRGWARYQAAKKRLQSDADYFNKLDAAHNEVISGSNYTNYGTHNASLGVASSARRSQTITHTSGEETYSRKDIIAFAGEHGLGTVRNEKAWFESIKRRMDEYYANQANNPNVKPPSRVTDATSVQKPEQERPSQSGAPTGLTPGSPVPGKEGATAATGYAHPTGQQGRVSSSFGMRVHPVSGIKKMHTGVDMAVPMGSSIQSVAEGKIIYAGKKGGYGYTVDVQHADGTISRYAHLSEFKAKVGDTVKAGQIIALSGGAKDHPGAGTSTGPHLHFEIRKDGVPVDPMPYLQQQMPAAVSKDGEKDKQQLSKPSDYDSWNPNLKKYIETLPPALQQKIFEQAEVLKSKNLGNINQIYETAIQQNPNMFSIAPKAITNAITNAPPGELPANFDPNDPIGSLTNVRDPRNPKLAGRQDPQGLYTESEFYADMENRKGSPFNYAFTEEGRKELGDRAQNIVTIQTNSGKKISVNAAAARDFKQFLDEIEARGYNIKDLGGYNNRDNVNKPGTPSMHAFGTAIDINPGQNPNKPRVPGTTDMPENMKYVAMKYGLAQIGSDRMHFERVSPALRKVYIQRLVQQGIIKPDDPVVQQRIQEGIITQEEVNKIKINPVRQQPIPQQAQQAQPTQTGTPPTQVITPSPQTTGSSKPQPVTPAAPATPAPATSQVQPQPTSAPATPQVQPQATSAPATPQVQPQATSAPAAPQPAATATPVQEAPPRQEDVPPKMKSGGVASLKGSDKAKVVNEYGKVVANVDIAGGENLLFKPGSNQVEGIPTQRISEIPQLRSDMPQQQNTQPQYEPEQQTMPTNMAAMTASPPSVPSAQENFYDVSDSSSPSGFFISESYKRAMMAYNKFQTTDRKIDNGSNTLFT